MSMRILIGGDEIITSEYMEWMQDSISGEILRCKDHDSLFNQLGNGEYHLLVLDLGNGEFNINHTLAMARKTKPLVPILVISESKDVEDAVNAFHLGATDYLTLPVDRLSFMEKVRQSFVDRSDWAQGETDQSPTTDNQLSEELIFGSSNEMMAFKEIIIKVKDTDLPVLITGESGTGKEILADYLWNGSARSIMPFVKV
ncbi:MAG: sigma 54-interacting transcriptional regulator, partial [Planctomycetota bacterium]